jgi:Tfp pilus assembly protein PilV
MRSTQGFTLVEVMIAGFILVTGVLGAVTLVNGANRTTYTTKERDAATNLARQIIEGSRSIPYAELSQNGFAADLKALPGLADTGPGAGWTIQRRGINYTVSASVCTADDPSDGVGVHDAGQFCSDSSATGTADTNPDDYKRVTADVTWKAPSGTQTVRQTTIVNNSGSAAGPPVSTLTMTSPASSPITTNPASASFSVATTGSAATVAWSIDGNNSGTASGSGTAWTFSWPLSTVTDGSYTVTATAYDSTGQAGTARSMTVTLNRFSPLAPTGLNAGRNGSVVDAEWLPNSERDVVRYRLKRVAAGGDVTVCDTTESSCQDPSPPAGALTYYVVAVDLDTAGANREGAHSSNATVTLTNHAPNAPTSLAGANTGTSTTLTWVAPSPQDPDAGDSIAFYRIYRDGVTYADRYDRTGSGSTLTYTDSHTGGQQHSYAITAVDTQLAESTILGPITR